MNYWIKFFAKHPIKTQMGTISVGIMSTFFLTLPIYGKIYHESGSGGWDEVVAMMYAGKTSLYVGSMFGLVAGLGLSYYSRGKYNHFKSQQYLNLKNQLKNDLKK